MCVMLFTPLHVPLIIKSQNSAEIDVVAQLPSAILIWRLSVLREIALSGFQLELYNGDEKAFAYWYTTQIIAEHVAALNSLISVVPGGTHPTNLHS